MEEVRLKEYINITIGVVQYIIFRNQIAYIGQFGGNCKVYMSNGKILEVDKSGREFLNLFNDNN